MCAIIGALGKKLPTQEQFIKARDTMTHRGPDDAGIYYAPQEGIALGHRRLSIIDLSEAGHQPFFSNDGRYTIVFNGEIYNYRELREELKNFYNFKTQTDTEVLLAAYIKWGSRSLQKLNGMFAFAVWDKKEKQLFVARDRLGVKPLYYLLQDGAFYFASEIKGILTLSNIERKLNKASFLDFLSFRYSLGEKTFFEGIYSLLPGHFLTISGGKMKLEQYWELPVSQSTDSLQDRDVIEKTYQLLKRSIELRLRSDVPTGAYLSGGLDSSLITAIMASLSGKKIKTFSVGFPEDGFNEFPFARKVAQLFNTDHHEITLSGKEYLDAIPETIRIKDAPLAVPFEVSGLILSKELKKYITVILAGEGADELFGGYGRIFRSGYDFERLHLLKDKLYLSGSGREVLEKNLLKEYGTLEAPETIDHFLNQYSYFELEKERSLLNPDLFSMDKKTLLNENFFIDLFSKAKELSQIEQYMYVFERAHLPGLLHRLDTSSMAYSVEAREPFIDFNLVEYVSTLPLKYKMRWKSSDNKHQAELLNSDQISEVHDTTKYLLREIGRKYLPDEIVNRKKLGPPAPLDQWFGADFQDIISETLLSPNTRGAPLYNKGALKEWLKDTNISPNSRKGLNIWMLYTFELWMREYNISL